MSTTASKAIRAECPDCGETITLRAPVKLGQSVICAECQAELEVIDTDPVELDWMYDDDNYDDDEYDDDDD